MVTSETDLTGAPHREQVSRRWAQTRQWAIHEHGQFTVLLCRRPQAAQGTGNRRYNVTHDNNDNDIIIIVIIIISIIVVYNEGHSTWLHVELDRQKWVFSHSLIEGAH